MYTGLVSSWIDFKASCLFASSIAIGLPQLERDIHSGKLLSPDNGEGDQMRMYIDHRLNALLPLDAIKEHIITGPDIVVGKAYLSIRR